jgi:hypothetical protein
MRYFSPLSLPDHPALDPPDTKALALQKRKLLAELQLSADGTVLIEDRSFTRNDILEYFETLQDESTLPYHAEIAKDPILLEFLANGVLPEDEFFLPAGLYEDIRFIQWVSPYFYTAFTEYLTECLQSSYPEGVQTLMRNTFLLTDYDQERAWIQIKHIFEQNIDQLDHYREQAEELDDTVLPIQEISALGEDPYIDTILSLPIVPFADVRNRYAVAIMQIAILTFNKRKENRNSAQTWLENAKRLAVSEDLITDIQSKIGEIEKIKGKSKVPVSAILIVAFLLFKLMSNESSTPGYSPTQFKRFTYVNGKDTVDIQNPKQIDSIFNHKPSPDSTQFLRIR